MSSRAHPGSCTTHTDVLNTELLAFFKNSRERRGSVLAELHQRLAPWQSRSIISVPFGTSRRSSTYLLFALRRRRAALLQLGVLSARLAANTTGSSLGLGTWPDRTPFSRQLGTILRNWHSPKST